MPDFERENAQLRQILEIARYMAVTPDLDALLTVIVDAVCDVLGCERATIFLYDRESNELFSRVAKGVESIRFPATAGIAGAVAQSREAINVPDAYADPRFNQDIDRKTGFRTRNLLTLPMENLTGELIGVLQALNKHEHPFDEDDEQLARVFSAQAGVALERSRLLEEYAEKQKLEHDLNIARSIQQSTLPSGDPKIEGLDISGWNRSADQTGGDSYDFFRLADGQLAVILADATGHGISAALIIAQCRALLRAALSVTTDLPAVMARVNALLYDDIADERFVTAFVGVIDSAAQSLEYVSAGQGPLLFLSERGWEFRTADALPLGVIPDASFDVLQRVELAPGDTIALLTDGFYEAANPARDQFGEERVAQLLHEARQAPAAEQIAALHTAVSEFVGGAPQADDLTAVLIRRPMP